MTIKLAAFQASGWAEPGTQNLEPVNLLRIFRHRGAQLGHDGLKTDTIASLARSVKLKMARETAHGERHMAKHNGARRKANGYWTYTECQKFIPTGAF